MCRVRVVVLIAGFFVSSVCAAAGPNTLRTGSWRAWLDCPGGELPFGLVLEEEQRNWKAYLVNGSERIEIPRVEWDGEQLVLDIDYYDSTIRAKVDSSGSRLDGEWKKRAAGGGWTKMSFHAVAGAHPRFAKLDAHVPTGIPVADVSGRWSVRFSSSEEPAVAVFERHEFGTVTGTFLTTTGDYRYLAGRLDGNRLRLSCFDGAHAFLFDAALRPDGTLAGDFWSRDTWHETWEARRDPSATLPDAFSLTEWTSLVQLSDLVFKDPDGRPHSLDDPTFRGRARIIEVFGTWCPNCHDATKYFVELDRKYRDAGLRIVALAFELTGDFDRDARQVRTYAKRHGIEYPILVAGVSDKKKASEALPILDRLRSYPTTLFVDGTGRVRAIHTGFAGPATGKEHQQLRDRFERLIEMLLAEGE